jgi:putative ABC transport system permease protein
MPVISTLSEYEQLIGSDSAGKLFITSGSWPIIYRYDEPQSVAVQAVSTDAMTQAGKKAADILNGTLSLPSDSTIKYKSEDLFERAKQMQDLANATRNQLTWVAGISLVVGGIGVMNIMLVSVTERIREIGLKKALGARKGVILFQFLTEAAVLTSIGGLIGVIAGIAVAQISSAVTQTPAAISPLFSVIGVLFSMLIGIAFGVFPAYKAANQNPIDALRNN